MSAVINCSSFHASSICFSPHRLSLTRRERLLLCLCHDCYTLNIREEARRHRWVDRLMNGWRIKEGSRGILTSPTVSTFSTVKASLVSPNLKALKDWCSDSSAALITRPVRYVFFPPLSPSAPDGLEQDHSMQRESETHLLPLAYIFILTQLHFPSVSLAVVHLSFSLYSDFDPAETC